MRLLLGGMGVAAAESAGFLDRLAAPEDLPDWLPAGELAHYVTEFSRTGFTGPLNWYRCFDRNWHILGDAEVGAGARTITVPALFIGGTQDPILGFTRTDRAREVVTGPYRQVLLEGAGHWIQQERADEINAELLEFLSHESWR